ncbi:VWFA and cache domain-containing protein 1 [Tribolium castaneum]|uniref:VWFA and cache domain-containing protein CG16868-like Protein n=1 Tax=Tribolium castaneum TaxID=7070 RepID=D7EK69_TRICA|nr:PREDICTED: VWFA and cache domain-containing protein 1 [Tribolium castaneum]EFA13000.2 VWFA and cache domain-containing protein CG16868-like Protein [Tribolium castaneum]|eukprot:XP_968102.1 PREDICTED: VWFA and cache domain-containing protein 1 [Tribolium castaneum]
MSSVSEYNSAFKSLALVLLIIPICVFTSELNDVWMRNVSKELGEDLGIIKNEELGISYIKKLYKTFNYTSAIIDANKTVNEIVYKLERKIDDIFSALLTTKAAIQNLQMLNYTLKIRSTLLPCIKNQTDKSEEAIISLLDKIKTHVITKNDTKQQYFISTSDLQCHYSPFINCERIDHMLLWKNFMSRNNYASKNIVLLLDHGGSLNKRHFAIVLSIAKQIVENLDEDDKIAILAISNDWSSPLLNEECPVTNQVPSVVDDVPNFTHVTASRKKLLYNFIDGMHKGSGATNHSLGLQKALKVIENSQIQNETVMILYISRGLLSSLTEAKAVLETIVEASQNISCPFVINTCAVIDDSRPTIYETQFLEDIALQNYQKYNISHPGNVFRGIMVPINSTETVGFALARFYMDYNQNYNLQKLISLPTWDERSNDLTISFSLGYLHNSNFGLLGLDVYFASWARELIYFSNSHKNYYAFLTDMAGRVILHPKFASVMSVKRQLQYVDISYFENVAYPHIVKKRLLNEREGFQLTTQFGSPVKWTWKRVGDWFIVCIVTHESPTPLKPHHITWPFNTSDDYSIRLVYRHLLPSESNLCRHFNQAATLDAGSLYLSSSCFQSEKKTIEEDLHITKNNTQQLEDLGLKPEIKDEVAALAYILSFLRSQHLSSFKSKYIVRRYVASYSGVLQMFPGSILDQGLDPTKRAWFVQAVEHKSKIIMIPPYLDEGGAGYIVTIAYATSDVVVALDVSYGFVFRTLLKRMPFCLATNVTCFLMDDRGYLIYHPNLINPNEHGPVEKQHIVHKESLVANDILSHKYFIKKVLCNSYGSGTVQRYYKLNTSYSDVLVSSVQGEHCVSYHIAAIRNSNVFVGMVNATCNVVVTFCPCSIVDRLCLNCNRMEQKECECPCECPLEQLKCTDYNHSNNPVCNWFPEHVTLKARFVEDATSEMKSCFPASCKREKTHLRCLGVTGCEWCKYDIDGSPLESPFCASMATCFNGIIGSVTPYRNSLHEIDLPEESFSVPISVITLFIFGVLLLLCMFYVYHRSLAPQATERLYLSSTQENHLRMSDLNLSDNYHAMGNHRDKLLHEDKPDPISPYCVSSNYKRTTLAADSDHGYSTMTQHDESEHMSLAPVEFDSLDDDLGSDSVSTHISVPNKGHVEPAQFTCIPRNKCIVVPVTVHRNMETT